MRRASSLGALARLELLHARGELRWALFAFGIDSEHDRGFLERTYQAYMALVVLVALGLMWSGVLAAIAAGAASLGESVAHGLAGALGAALPAAALLVDATRYLRGSPFGLIRPDFSFLARLAAPEELVLARSWRPVAAHLLCGVLVGWTLAVLAGAASVSVLVWAAGLAARLVAAWLAALLAGLARCAVARPGRRATTAALGVSSLGVAALASLAAAAPTPAWCAAVLVLACADARVAERADMAFVIDDSAPGAALHELRHLALVDAGAYGEARRHVRRRCRRVPRASWHFGTGPRACTSRALAALVRRPSSLGGLLSLAALLSVGAVLMAQGTQTWLLLGWLLCLGQGLVAHPPELGAVFRDDCANRLLRGLLPLSTLGLLASDVLPALSVSVGASLVVTGAAAALVGASLPAALALTLALHAVVTLACGLDDPRRVALGPRLTCMSFSVLAYLAAGALALLGAVWALGCLVAGAALLVWWLR